VKLKFKINLKKSRILEWIKVPKTLIEGKPWKHKLPNFVEKRYLKETFNFEYDKKNKILTSIDNHPKVIHGIYSKLNFKLTKEVQRGMYTHGWFTGFEGRFVGHDILFRHFVTFDELENTYTLINKVGFFFRKDGDDNFTLPSKEDECGAYVWMERI
jgi:hypothetical protein